MYRKVAPSRHVKLFDGTYLKITINDNLYNDFCTIGIMYIAIVAVRITLEEQGRKLKKKSSRSHIVKGDSQECRSLPSHVRKWVPDYSFRLAGDLNGI